MIKGEDVLKFFDECINDKFENSHMIISILRGEDSVETIGLGNTEIALQSVAVLFEQLIENGYDRGELFYAVADILNKEREEL